MSKIWLSALLLAASPAAAHEWYPIECCHEMDCAPVEHVEIVPTPTTSNSKGAPAGPPEMVVTTKIGTVLVPASFPRRESKDNRMHACMMPGPGGQMQLICLFIPPSM
jgi:hypothetical protein